jgi:hypothetical protein
VVVRDEAALLRYARRRHRASWGGAELGSRDVATAVLEALVISNENPSPADYGIEIGNAEAQRASPR